MPRLRRLVPLALVLAAAAPVAARADAPWSAPVEVPGASGYGTPLVVTAAGRALVAAPGAPGGAVSQLVALGPDGTPGRATGLGVAETHLATYGRDRVVVAGRTAHPIAGNAVAVTIDDTSRVQVAFGTGGGDLGPMRSLPGTTGDQLYALAASPRGDVTVVTGDLRARTRTLWLRRPGESFRAVLTVAVGPRARGATGAVGAAGDALLVWEDDHVISSRHIGPGGGVGKAYKLGDGVQSDLQAAIDGTRRELVAWKAQRVSEGEASGPATVRLATAAPGRGFGPARTVETVGPGSMGHYVAPPGVRLAVAGDRALLAWTGWDGAHYVVRAAAVEGGHVRRSQQLSPAGVDAVLGDAALDPGGCAVAVWRSGVLGAGPARGTHQQVWANARPAAATPFGTPEALSAPDRDVPSPPAVALDPLAHRALAAFTYLVPASVAVTQRP